VAAARLLLKKPPKWSPSGRQLPVMQRQNVDLVCVSISQAAANVNANSDLPHYQVRP